MGDADHRCSQTLQCQTAMSLALVSWPAKMTTPSARFVLRRLEPLSSMEAGDRGMVTSVGLKGGLRSRLPVKVYSEALGCSQFT